MSRCYKKANKTNPVKFLHFASFFVVAILLSGSISFASSAKSKDEAIPLGDNKLSYDGPKKGYLYLCNSGREGGGAQQNGPWIQGNYWYPSKKLTVDGAVSWKNAKGTFAVKGDSRTFNGNDLPSVHTTGIYPIQSSDDAYQYDRNPNSIKSQTVSIILPKDPKESTKPNCVSGEVGITLSGVALFNGFDAEHRDAPAHELQDTYGGHPQISGTYHYHNIMPSLEKLGKQAGNSTLVGYAFDGFGIFGSVENGKKLTNDNLDECHGHTHPISWDGKTKKMYHYHATDEFPYTVSCFKGKPAQKMVTQLGQQDNQGQPNPPQQNGQGQQRQPPQIALDACNKKSSGNACQFTGTNGENLSGVCRQVPSNNNLACVPSGMPLP
ncbi:MAG: YHYH protein [Thaumarchaeota archaeon]|nr:YHYH protein [Nitrososphaerota archaeon]NDF47804.1 YHYH protein [Nitrosopumilaceae archaeon]